MFGSEEEEEDPEVVKKREENLAAYKKKKEGKVKPAAKSLVTMDVKPWGMFGFLPLAAIYLLRQRRLYATP